MIRNFSIDLLKALAIVLVVIGHSIQYSYPNADSLILYNIIYSFHMPLFFFISGYCAFASYKGSEYLLKKFNRLIIPFLSWLVIYGLFYNINDVIKGDYHVFFQFYLNVLMYPDQGGLWFLWVLFMVHVIYFYFNKTRYLYIFSIFLILFLYAISVIWNFDTTIFGLRLFRNHYLFFIMGCLFKEFNVIHRIKGIYMWAIFAALIFFECIWNRLGSYSFGLNLPEQLLFIYNNLIYYFVAVSAIIFLYYFSQSYTKNHNIIQWLSENTLAIYASHFIFIFGFLFIFGKYSVRPFILCIILFIWTFSASFLIIYLIKMNKLLKKLLL